ncbi:MAG: hypothetical protein U1A81_15300 [Hydrogenophaga sp.]|nr:hypothetical protein [Hydrogenophaga sp.]
MVTLANRRMVQKSINSSSLAAAAAIICLSGRSVLKAQWQWPCSTSAKCLGAFGKPACIGESNNPMGIVAGGTKVLGSI